MIQDSVNQMLGQAGIIGGYLGHMRTGNISSEMKGKADMAKYEAKMLSRYGDTQGVADVVDNAKKEIAPKTLKEKLTTPVINLMESKNIGRDLDSFKTEEYNNAVEGFAKNQKLKEEMAGLKTENKDIQRALNVSNKARMSMVRASKLAQAKQEQANNNFTTNFGKSNELPPKMKEFVENEMKKGGNV